MQQNDIVKRLAYSGLMAAFGAAASVVAARLAAVAYRRIFDEDPPE
jgi:ABC-type spermidine/putrescine transport system permease subunit II